ncbi:hypothetical protein MRB53_021033 [Persea americana]|uniref:Uncharacterized protein n=1 Tax=Persea americana TaxID=3435 RepID=A0ACC2L3I1_PERAE|nr:hypothetical protein MRB53_021033 [Persea americana]
MAMQMFDRLKCVSSVELQRNEEAKVVLEIDLRRKAAWMGSVEETVISRSCDRFLVSDGYVFRFGSRYRLSSGFFDKCELGVTNALHRMGAFDVAEDSKRDLLDYVYNISKRVMRLPTKEIVIHAEIDLVTVFQSQSEASHAVMQPQPQPQPQMSYSRSRLDESLVFVGDPSLMPSQSRSQSQSQGVDGGHRRSDQSQSLTSDVGVIVRGSARQSDQLDALLQESVLLAEQRGFTTLPATTAAIEKLETKKFKEEDELTGHRCTICLDGLIDGMQLPCMHAFHQDCITTWLKQCNSCPLCRFRL